MRKLEDLDVADDHALLSHRLQDMKEKVDSLREASQRVGLRISQEKTKVMRINSRQEAPVTIEGMPAEDVKEFVYLGSKISQTGGQTRTSQQESGKLDRPLLCFARCGSSQLSPPEPNSAYSVQTSSLY